MRPASAAFPALLVLMALPVFFALALPQPVTPIGVLWWITVPFCATISVGIFSACLQRLPFAASAE